MKSPLGHRRHYHILAILWTTHQDQQHTDMEMIVQHMQQIFRQLTHVLILCFQGSYHFRITLPQVGKKDPNRVVAITVKSSLLTFPNLKCMPLKGSGIINRELL